MSEPGFAKVVTEVFNETQTNSQPVVLVIEDVKYERGEITETAGNEWPREIQPGARIRVQAESKFPKGLLNAGCCGYVTYVMGKERKRVSIAFSNLGDGNNMVTVDSCSGPEAMRQLRRVYSTTHVLISVDDVIIDFIYSCSMGAVNTICLEIRPTAAPLPPVSCRAVSGGRD